MTPQPREPWPRRELHSAGIKHGDVGRAVRLASCDDLLEEMLGSATVQRPNVINANGVHFNKCVRQPRVTCSELWGTQTRKP